MNKLFSVGLVLIAILCCKPSVHSQSFVQPEFADSKEELLREIFGSDNCTIGVGYDSKRNFGVEIITNYLNFGWHLNEDSDPRDEVLFKNKFNKLLETAPVKINNIGNYNIIQMIVYKDDKQVYKLEQRLE